MQQSQGIDFLRLQELLDEIKDLLRGAWRYRWQALIVAWLVCLASWSYVLVMPDVYRASSRLQIDTEDTLQPLLRGMAVETDLLEDVKDMLKSILSRPTLERIATVSGFDLGNPNPAELDSMLNDLRNGIELGINREQVLEIGVEHSNPNVAFAVVDVLIDILVQDLLRSSTADVNSAQDFLQKKLKEYELLLSEAEGRLAEFKKKNVGLMPGEQGNYFNRLQQEMRQLEELDSRLRLARQRRDMLEQQLAGEQPSFGLMARSGGQAVTSPQIKELEGRLTQLRMQYTDEHPDVVSTLSLLQELRAEVLRTQGAQPQQTTPVADQNPVYQQIKIQYSQAELELSQAQTERAEQSRRVEALKQKIDTIPEIEAELTRLNRNYDVYREQHSELVSRLEKARMSEDAKRISAGLKFRVIDPPSVGNSPVGPNRSLLLTAGFVVALSLGMGLAGLRSIASPVYYRTSRLERQFGVKVLGAIKLVRSPEEMVRARMGMLVLACLSMALVTFYGLVLVFNTDAANAAAVLASRFG